MASKKCHTYLQEVLLEVPEPELELALELEEVRALLIDVGALRLEDLVEALHLQRAPRDGEVDHGDPGADVGPELDGGVARRQEDRERRREVNVLQVTWAGLCIESHLSNLLNS